jgi:hypothetical protein
MTGFEPIAGSMAAVALLEPAFRAFKWIYGKYRLTEEFGPDFVAFTIKYKSEVWKFESIRDQEIHTLQKSPLNEARTLLDPPVKQRLLLWMKALEDCEQLVASCDPRTNSENDTTPLTGSSIDYSEYIFLG